MATFNEKDATLLYVGKSSATALTTGDIDTLGDGEIGIFEGNGVNRLTGTPAANTDFRLVQGRGTDAPIVGKKFNGTNIKDITVGVPVVKTEQVAYVGYDGATAASQIDVLASNLYYIRTYVDQSLTSNHGGQYVKHAVYESPATGATELSIAEGLIANGNNNMLREPEEFMRYDLVCDEALAAAFDFDNTVTVTNGSKIISVATNLDYNTGGGTLAVGDYIRLSNDGGTTNVALTSELYKVVAINALEVTLDKAYLGTTGTLATGGSNNQVLTGAAVAGAQCGVKIQGRPLKWTLGKFNYRLSKFDVSLDDFGTTPLVSTAGTPGVGTYEQTAELEWFYRGNNGEYFRMGQPNIFPAIADVANEPYAVVVVSIEEAGGGVTQNKREIKLMLAIPSNTSGVTVCTWAKNGTANSILNVLDAMAGTNASASLT